MSLNTFSFLITPQEKKQILKSNLVKYLPIKNNYIEYLLEYKKTKITIYKTQKCLIQGNETKQVIETFFDSHLPNLALMNPKIQQTNIIGSDEVGVGDYFGGLCVCAVFLDDKLVAKINDLNIKDSKLLDDTTICDLAIKLIAIVPYEIYNILPIEYNHLIELYHNSHVIKTIGHYTTINKLVDKLKSQNKVIDEIIIDEYASKDKFHAYLNQAQITNNKLHFTFCTHAETKYLAVACASIIARYFYLEQIKQLSLQAQIQLPLGAWNNKIENASFQLINQYHGNTEEINRVLNYYVKLHFSNTQKIITKLNN